MRVTDTVGSVRIQEGDHREDPAMVVAGLGQVELGQDAAHVLLHGACGDPKPMGDTGIRPALRHQRQHLLFAHAQDR